MPAFASLCLIFTRAFFYRLGTMDAFLKK